MSILKNISDDAGLKRKLEIIRLKIEYNVYVQIEGIVRHYENVNGSYGKELTRFNYPLEKNTLDSYIYIATGLTATPNGKDENGLPTFPDNKKLEIDVIPELMGLESTQTYSDILTLQSGILDRLDVDGKIIKLN